MPGAGLFMARRNGRVAQSPVDALIDLRVGYWLHCQISDFRFQISDFNVTRILHPPHLRITVLLQR